ncbi:osmotically inducible protein OsmC [Caulobacter sp. D4A]|uniref:OsmC family protein n=1 Tax=unclassified Caulobacter TaxID=2648921 RepID=UPI000D72AC75|nr:MULTISPECIES: OsmC family protein [unclassified Caulobacter]PXA74408.1 osmotically inducible protein OsmC [Caulobacter sp. D4A]PXA90280.1 osmotically inducible protein OsmC [Caulobacter sp. D5]
MTDVARPSAIAEDSGHGGVQILITAGPARIAGDLKPSEGGLDTGPNPHDLVAAGLAACTTQTLRLYAKRKGWALGEVRVETTWRRVPSALPADVFDRVITLSGDLDETQRQRLMEIAEACPVHKMLSAGVKVETRAG